MNLKLEAVSLRLKSELIHPNKTGWLVGLKFSLDGKRIIASDYPSGVIVVWDVVSGKRLTTIDTIYRRIVVSPDWRTLFAPHGKRRHEHVEQDGKPMLRWIFDGEIRVWSLEDGKLLRTYRHQPPRGIDSIQLSPNGTKFITTDDLSGIYERSYKSTASLWNAKSGEYRTLDGRHSPGPFSPDGRYFSSILLQEEGSYAQARKLIDVATGQEKWSIPVEDKNASLGVSAFSRDGRILFGTVQVFDRPNKWDHWRSWMKWWDAATGREMASFEGEKDGGFFIHDRCFSPDGQILAVFDWKGDKKKTILNLYSIAEKRLLRTVVLGEKMEGLECWPSDLTFHPAGRWLAVITRLYPETDLKRDLDPRDLPRPRILLIETAAGEIRETMIAPQAIAYTACFSPDGGTLATGGHGRVLL